MHSTLCVPEGTPPTDGRRRSVLELLPEQTRADVLHVLWRETRPFRAGLHRLLRVRCCDTALVWGSVRLGAAARHVGSTHGLLLGGDCLCRDVLADALAEADRYLAGRSVANPPGAIRVHLRTRVLHEWIRAARVAQGAQARTDRIRGSELGGHLPDELHRAVLEFLVDEAGSPAPLEGDDQLVHRLAGRVAEEFGGTPGEHLAAVAAAVARVEAVCRSGRRVRDDGELVTWWERFVQRPLGRRSRHSDLSVDTRPGTPDEPALDVACPAAEVTLDEMLDRTAYGHGGLDGAVIATVLARADGPDAPQAIVAVIATLAARDVLAPAAARGFAADPDRIRAAIDAVAVLRVA